MEPDTLVALAEPTRLRIVELLRSGQLTVGEIANELHIRQPQASKHLKVLSEAKIVEVYPVANRRIYRLRAQPFQEMNEWLGTFRKFWEDQFDQLDAYLAHIQKENNEEE